MHISNLDAIPVDFLGKIKAGTLNFIISHISEQLVTKKILYFLQLD